ncbi:rhamnulokinase [Aquipluma nitroreducens]|uniref:Rhamnulokinase n=1 Tax=Aquipluma nitroreducens TaxID=2010828 RepID=A0A5K7S4I2_9BACT|nr:rhamnulokinase [Aquipluma nitroreducens]BBE16436.1 rhamnulokinase [Aquipluma nitroreducens]
MNKKYFLAFDLGASSGRAILGTLINDTLELTEIHRFSNQMQLINGHYFWNIFSLFNELKAGLKKCVKEYGIQPESIGVDTWGVDFVHLNKEGLIISLPFAYRDSRTNTSMDDLFQIVPQEEVYAQTGIQFMQFNSLFQLFSMVKDQSSLLEITDSILFMPDALNYLFSGVKKSEFSIASTSQMIVPGKCEWNYELIEKAGIPKQILQEIILPGTILGNITNEVANETGSKSVPVIAVAGHDTASAIVSTPCSETNFAYISSGTWSLMGIECPKPHISAQTHQLNFTNEGGVNGTTRFLKNIMGMWLIQEVQRIWEAEGMKYTWPAMVELARRAEPFQFLINPDDSMFLNPRDMTQAIRDFCYQTAQGTPQNHGEVIRCIYDSLALKYRFTLEQIRDVSDQPIEVIHIIGGGANNHFLNQLTADATGLDVVAGPTEATAIGNIMIQAKALGYVGSLTEIRQIIANSSELVRFIPSGELDWDEAYNRYLRITL